jgi:mRNA-degrading endonuclease toxin of MazEF toxin-antitoxin module
MRGGTKEMKIERGDIIICDFGEQPGTSIQDGVRPAVVVSNDKANRHSPVITVVPLSCRTRKKRYMPTHVFIPYKKTGGLHRNSMALAEQVTSIDCKYIVSWVGMVDPDILEKIIRAVEVQISSLK